MDGLFERFATQAGLGPDPDLIGVVEAVRAIPYRRPVERTPAGVVGEWAGTCSTKHLLLSRLMAERFPRYECRLVHRVYRVTPELARTSFGTAAAAAVPSSGLLDVHTYATIDLGGHRALVDVTFAGATPWDGHSDMALACGEGIDHDAGDDAMSTKAALIASYCDRRVREPFIAALTEPSKGQTPSESQR